MLRDKENSEEYSNKKAAIKQYIYKSRKFLNKEQYEDALEMADLAICTGQNTIISARAYCMRSKIHFAQNNINKALQDIEKAIELNPKYDEPFRIRADYLVHEKRFDEAIKDCETVYELNKEKDYDILFKIGKIYCEKNEFENAIVYYTKSIELGKATSEVYGSRALVYYQLGKLQECEADRVAAGLPTWFIDINPMFYDRIAAILRSPNPEIVKYILAGKERNPNGTIVFGPRLAKRAFDAKTGKLLWIS